MFLENLDVEKLYCTMTFLISATADAVLVEGPFDKMVIIAGTGCYYGVSGTVSGTLLSPTLAEFDVAFDANDSASDESCTPGILEISWVEPIGETFVDFQNDGENAGDAFVWSDKGFAVTLADNAEILISTSGRCFVFPQGAFFCSYTVELPGGTILFRGYFEAMTIIGGTGCYRGIKGRVNGSDEVDGAYVLTFNLE